MSEFERKLPPCRLAEVNYGDTLQKIAAREMGDANRWPELVWINGLSHPYVTDDERQAGPGVLLYGGSIKVPAPAGFTSGNSERGEIYQTDCALVKRLLESDDDGDLLVFSGTDNLRQQLSHVVSTPLGQATRHPDYGCKIWRMLGTVNGPLAVMMGAEYVKAALRSDFRVASVDATVAEANGDVLRITARATAIDGQAVEVTNI